MPSLILKPQGRKALLRRHPWVFSGAVGAAEGDPGSGGTVDVLDQDRAFLARAAFSPRSQIAARVWTFDPDETIGPAFFRARIERAAALRRAVVDPETVDAYRVVNAESDGLPGVVVDRYAGFLVCQFASAGAERWKKEIVGALRDTLAPEGIYERSDVRSRAKEGLEPATGLLAGREPPDLVEVREGPDLFLVDVRRGQKTGFYLDQRENRAVVSGVARGAEVLNVFAYTGSFAVAALRGGARAVTSIETSTAALEIAAANIERNGHDPSRARSVEGNAFTVLRKHRDEGRRFDLVVLDPPKFAESAAQVPRASRAYKDVNLLAFRLLAPGGTLVTFSCSGHVGADLFQKIVADAALDARREARIVRRLAQAPDHPVLLSFPEASYLKGLVCRVE
ncbi:MAG: class I SAM-dependent methyltransferase [Candidatus Eisenbacteria bacterium]